MSFRRLVDELVQNFKQLVSECSEEALVSLRVPLVDGDRKHFYWGGEEGADHVGGGRKFCTLVVSLLFLLCISKIRRRDLQKYHDNSAVFSLLL